MLEEQPCEVHTAPPHDPLGAALPTGTEAQRFRRDLFVGTLHLLHRLRSVLLRGMAVLRLLWLV